MSWLATRGTDLYTHPPGPAHVEEVLQPPAPRLPAVPLGPIQFELNAPQKRPGVRKEASRPVALEALFSLTPALPGLKVSDSCTPAVSDPSRSNSVLGQRHDDLPAGRETEPILRDAAVYGGIGGARFLQNMEGSVPHHHASVITSAEIVSTVVRSLREKSKVDKPTDACWSDVDASREAQVKTDNKVTRMRGTVASMQMQGTNADDVLQCSPAKLQRIVTHETSEPYNPHQVKAAVLGVRRTGDLRCIPVHDSSPDQVDHARSTSDAEVRKQHTADSYPASIWSNGKEKEAAGSLPLPPSTAALSQTLLKVPPVRTSSDLRRHRSQEVPCDLLGLPGKGQCVQSRQICQESNASRIEEFGITDISGNSSPKLADPKNCDKQQHMNNYKSRLPLLGVCNEELRCHRCVEVSYVCCAHAMRVE